MTDATTFPTALAVLSADLGAPRVEEATRFFGRSATWRRESRFVLLAEGAPHRQRLRLATFADIDIKNTWTLAGTPTPDAPSAPLADAVRDVAAWLRGAQDAAGTGVGRG